MAPPGAEIPKTLADVYPLTPRLQKEDLSGINTEIVEISDNRKAGPTSIEGALRDALKQVYAGADDAAERQQTTLRAILGRVAPLLNTDFGKNGDKVSLNDGFLLLEDGRGEKYAFSLTDAVDGAALTQAPEGYRLVTKREDIRVRTRRSWQSLDDVAKSGILSRVLQLTQHATGRLGAQQAWAEMQMDPSVSLENLKTLHPDLAKNLQSDFLDGIYKGTALQNRAIIQYLVKKKAETGPAAEAPPMPTPPDPANRYRPKARGKE